MQLSYEVCDFSSSSGNFSPSFILVNKPSDQKSRWLSDGNKPPQEFLMLKLAKPAIVCKIYFGKYEKSHPCNIQKLRVCGGLDPQHTHLLLDGGLKNDTVPEMLNLQCHVDGQPFPCQYVKIIPLQTWGGSFNFSIWHVQLWGIAEESQVDSSLRYLMQFKEREAVRLCLKHLRQYDYSEAFEALQKKSKILLEDPVLTQLHSELVSLGDFEAAEGTVCRAVEEGYFDGYIEQQLIKAHWTSIPYPVEGPSQRKRQPLSSTPDMRGGHQMCLDSEVGVLYLCGGWDGSKELGDFWQFTISSNKWTCLSPDTALQGGPGPKSCHAMCLDPQQKCLYVLGGYVDSPSNSDDNHKPPCVLFSYSIGSSSWRLISSDTFKDGGPPRVYDHQMCYDCSSGLLYVLGGRIAFTDLCSGLYAFHTVDQRWLCLAPDQSPDSTTPQLAVLPRSGHAMVFHPGSHRLFIMGGERQRSILGDMLTYDVRSGETSILADVPVADSTLRAALDLYQDQICLTGQNGQGDKEPKGVNSVWLYDITSAQWSKVIPDENAPSYDSPCPRYAHSFVCDSPRQCFYMFGGNPGSGGTHAKATSNMRLDDLWRMQLTRQSKENFLREWQLSLRTQRFRELSVSSPVAAVNYLQTAVAALVDHSSYEESRQYRHLTGSLFGSEVKGVMSTTERDAVFKRMRRELYDKLASCFPQSMAQPKDNLVDLIKLK